jgi:hypothetical protein
MLRGGLGNQLFQWALASELQERGRQVVLDIRQVDAARGTPIISVDGDMSRSTLPSLGWNRRRQLPRGRTASGYRPIHEPSFHYWPGIFEAMSRRDILHGYWQSPRYFMTVRDRVRNRVLAGAHAALNPSGVRLLREISTTEGTVSVHLRRGDYVANAVAASYHGVVPEEYYARALTRMTKRGATRFYVFSDDEEYAARWASRDRCEFVRHGVASSPLGELGLMAACGSHVLANSSFSWWGAWLSDHSSEVIAPRQWFADSGIDTQDLLPDQWTRL